MIVGIDVISYGTLALLVGVFCYSTWCAWTPKRWDRPVVPSKPAQFDPETVMELLWESIEASPNRERGLVDVAGVRVSASWTMAIEVRPGSGAVWAPGYWSLDVDGYRQTCPDLDRLYTVALARLRAIADERAQAYELEVTQ